MLKTEESQVNYLGVLEGAVVLCSRELSRDIAAVTVLCCRKGKKNREKKVQS